MEISITRALSELKTLDSRINKQIMAINYASMSIGKKPVQGYNSNDEYKDKVKSQYQSVQDLIKRRQEIKSKIVESNAKTMVRIGGEEMSVASAIERKSSIQYERNLLNKLISDYNNATAQVERKNYEVQERLDKMLEANFGKDAKAKDTEVDDITKPYLANNEAKLIDPISLRDEIEKLSERIDTFLGEIDFTLSESNTITKITIVD